MTAAELIAILEKVSPDAIIRVRGEEYDWTEHVNVWTDFDVSIEAEG